MKIRCALVLPLLGVGALWFGANQTSAQGSQTSQGQVVLSKLAPPAYPPLARAANVSGDVEIVVRIRQDGTIESAEVAGGHPLLKEAALDSARQSEFECHQCGEAPTPYSVLYTFGFTTQRPCCALQEAPAPASSKLHAGITQSQNRITILTDPFCICDPPDFSVKKVRSAKCLFLWHCGKG